MTRRVLPAAIALFCGLAFNAGAADWMAELQRIQQKETNAEKVLEEAGKRALAAAKPIAFSDQHSLSMQGGSLAMQAQMQAHTQLQNGRLYYCESNDFERRVLRIVCDPTYPLAKALKEGQESIAAASAIQGLPPDWRTFIDGTAARWKTVRTAADLATVESLSIYSRSLTGKAQLTSAQILRISGECARNQQLYEELGRLVQAREKQPDATVDDKINKTWEQIRGLPPSWLHDPEFFSPEQKTALGMDRPRGQRRAASAFASASASAGGGDDAASAAAVKEWEKKAAEQKAQEDARKAAAKLNFVLKGKNAVQTAYPVKLHEGVLTMYVETLPEGGRFVFTLDESQTWARQKEEWLKTWPAESHETLRLCESSHAFEWGTDAEKLRKKTGSVPPDVQSRLAALVKEMDDASATLSAAYKSALEKPADEKLQRALFAAVREAYRTSQRNGTLCRRSVYDRGEKRDDLPWLLSLEQLDLASAGELCTSSSASSCSDGTSVSISARPAGDKQYVRVAAENTTLGALAPQVLSAARNLYHNHKLKLSFDPAAAANPIRGMIEGKSPEELLKSLALRAGVNLVKDEKEECAWVLK